MVSMIWLSVCPTIPIAAVVNLLFVTFNYVFGGLLDMELCLDGGIDFLLVDVCLILGVIC
jgi:hypothetical protein